MKGMNFTFLFIIAVTFSSQAQISFQGCDAFLANGGTSQTYTLTHVPAQDVVARHTYVSSPTLACDGLGGGSCPVRIIWTGSQWEIQLDASGAGTFAVGNALTLYTNPAASTPNPPDLTLNTWSEATGNTGGACGGTAGIATLSGDVQNTLSGGGGGTPTPVKLTSFLGQLKNQAINLTWQTAVEINNSHFDLERSADGVNFEAVGTIEGKGTTTEAQHYTFVDTKPLLGYNYYRLKQVDYDGASEYSSIIAVNYEANDEVLQVFPSPASDVLQVVTNPENDLTQNYVIVDVTGTVLQEGILSNTARVHSINISNLPAGAYALQLLQKQKKGSQTTRFIKQ